VAAVEGIEVGEAGTAVGVMVTLVVTCVLGAVVVGATVVDVVVGGAVGSDDVVVARVGAVEDSGGADDSVEDGCADEAVDDAADDGDCGTGDSDDVADDDAAEVGVPDVDVPVVSDGFDVLVSVPLVSDVELVMLVEASGSWECGCGCEPPGGTITGTGNNVNGEGGNTGIGSPAGGSAACGFCSTTL